MKLLWQFVFINESENIIILLKHVILILTVFIQFSLERTFLTHLGCNQLEQPHNIIAYIQICNLQIPVIININVCPVYLLTYISYHTYNPSNILTDSNINLHICDHSIITFGEIGFCLGFSKTSHVGSLYRFRKVFVEKFYNAAYNFKGVSSHKDKINLNILMNPFTTWYWVILQHVFISLFIRNKTEMTHRF